MRRIFAICLFLAIPMLQAQSPFSGHSELDRMQQERLFEKWALDPGADPKIAEARRAAVELQEFYGKAQEFVDLWTKFAADLNTGKTFNAKLAKKVSKAFHELERSEGWPVGRSK